MCRLARQRLTVDGGPLSRILKEVGRLSLERSNVLIERYPNHNAKCGPARRNINLRRAWIRYSVEWMAREIPFPKDDLVIHDSRQIGRCGRRKDCSCRR